MSKSLDKIVFSFRCKVRMIVLIEIEILNLTPSDMKYDSLFVNLKEGEVRKYAKKQNLYMKYTQIHTKIYS